jgi:hypothetical protein
MGEVTQLHESLNKCHPSLARGQVWCTKCGHTRCVNSGHCFANGWPICCGETMTIDSPAERAALKAKASLCG